MGNMKRAPRLAAETFEAKFALAEADESAGTFKGMASVFGAPIDCYPPSIIERGAFVKTLAEQGERVKILWQHDTWDPIGKPVSLTETPGGLELLGRLDDVENGRRAMKQIKSGTLTDLSIGFDPIKWEMASSGDPTQEPIRVIKEVKLWEVSIVTFGAQRAATMNAFAQAFRDLPIQEADWNAAEAATRVRKWAGADQPRLYRAFLAAGKMGEQLQIADVVEGRLVVIPGALHAAAETLMKGTALPEAVVEYAKEHLGAYFRKMGTAIPWEKETVVPVPAETHKGRKLSASSRAKIDEAMKNLKALIDAADDSEKEDPPPGSAEAEAAAAASASPAAFEAPAPVVKLASKVKCAECDHAMDTHMDDDGNESKCSAEECDCKQFSAMKKNAAPAPVEGHGPSGAAPAATPAVQAADPKADEAARLAAVDLRLKEMEMANALLSMKAAA